MEVRLGGVVVVGLLMGLVGCFRLDNHMYNPKRVDRYLFMESPIALADYPIPDSLIHLVSLSSGGYTIYAVYVGHIDRIVRDTVIVYCHGNTGNLDYYWPRIQLLAYVGGAFRYGVFAVDYRGFGMSEGEPSERGLIEDVLAGIRWLRARGLTGDRLVLYGFSLGTVPATYLAAYPELMEASWLVLEAPLASVEAIVQDASQMVLPASFVSDLRMSVADWIRDVSAPLLLLHGSEDRLLNWEAHGRVVYERHPGPKRLVLVLGADHSDVPWVMGLDAYRDTVHSFLVAFP